MPHSGDKGKVMEKNSGQLVQAVPLIEGKVNLGAGTYQVNSLIHCETDAAITFGPNAVPYSMLAGSDRGFKGEIVVVSGTVTID